EGGNVVMPLAKTFWSEKFGEVTDKFGVGWKLNLS
ncbi:TPA: VOC family protein, partial [Listeria monocytogenes]